LWRASELNEVARWSASSEAYSTSRPHFPQVIYLLSLLFQCQPCQKSRLGGFSHSHI
jgi:hypothetical protein